MEPADEINKERDIFANGPEFKKLQQHVTEILGYEKLIDSGEIRYHLILTISSTSQWISNHQNKLQKKST